MREPGTDDEKPLYVDISAMLDGTAPEPPEPILLKRSDGRRLFYAGQVNLLFGDPESGKTWIGLACAVEALHAGRRVLVMDLDHNGPQSTVHRLLALGAPQDRLRDPGVFRYCEPEDRTEVRQVVDDSVQWRPAVAVVDSIGELLPMHGANTNSADEFTTVHSSVLKPLAKAGAAVLGVDHLAKGMIRAPTALVGPRRSVELSVVCRSASKPPKRSLRATAEKRCCVSTKTATAVYARTAPSVTANPSPAPSNSWHSTTESSNGR